MITINVTKMFCHREPWDCSNSMANLGPKAGELTWACAMEVAEQALRDAPDNWRVEGVTAYVDAIKRWAQDTGAWDREEIATWTEQEALALLVQNVASDMRELGSDDQDLEACAARSLELAERAMTASAVYVDEVSGDVMAYWCAL